MVADVFLSILETSISVSLIIVLLMMLAPFLNKRYAAKWKYWIWIFLALRLIIPFNGTNGMSVIDALAQMKDMAVLKTGNSGSDILLEQTTVPRRVIIEVPAQMSVPLAAHSENDHNGITPLDIVAFVWMAGGMIFMSAHLISYLCYKRQVSKDGVIVKEPGILRQLFEVKRKLHIKCTVRIVEYSEADSPMMIGFLKPLLVLPDGQYSPEELFFILKHELVHLKRKDVYVKLLFVVANAIHWFNPFVWIMQKEAEVDMELSCDERVTQGGNYAMRKAYTEALLSTLHKQSTKRNLLSTQFYGGKKIMKKRFKNILIKTRKKNGAAILITAAILTVGLGTLVGCSVGNHESEEIPEQTEDTSQPQEAELDITDVSEAENELPPEEIPAADIPNEEDTAQNTRTLTFIKEGEPEEKQASLVIDQVVYDEFSFYLPDGEWQKEEAAMWQSVVNENVRLWVALFEKDYHIEQVLADDGYEQENGGLVKREDGLVYKARLYEDGNHVWCVEYCYPEEAEEGWGIELPVIADTFAVISEDIHG